MKVFNSALNSSGSSPTLWISFDHEWTSEPHKVSAGRLETDALIQQLPQGVRDLLEALVDRQLLAEVEITRPATATPQSPQNQLRVRAVPVGNGTTDGSTRLFELVVAAERLTGHLRPTDDELAKVADSAGQATQSARNATDSLRLRWLLAMQRLVDKG